MHAGCRRLRSFSNNLQIVAVAAHMMLWESGGAENVLVFRLRLADHCAVAVMDLQGSCTNQQLGPVFIHFHGHMPDWTDRHEQGLGNSRTQQFAVHLQHDQRSGAHSLGMPSLPAE